MHMFIAYKSSMINKQLKLEFAYCWFFQSGLEFYERICTRTKCCTFLVAFSCIFFSTCIPLQSWEHYQILLHFWDSSSRNTIVAIQFRQYISYYIMTVLEFSKGWVAFHFKFVHTKILYFWLSFINSLIFHMYLCPF